ncbi:DUF1848 domain-containing protein [Paenibacillus athensensis]|uniref:DUF1848 domain-containing protein n=1 Tax=Paenibacillus athensensis TaxID=1967502 RepID=A0A4Y8PSH6_9BACL|nr:DUF1848 domain-containing protein [Paenibacillus athensensis]MCD1258615.1 DUF1848 domain-containing protein [Paenibacillus athensensis]
MIVSASRRTDIPAFFAEWFMQRVREGYVYRVNPFHVKMAKAVSLKPGDVDGIVFWTKQPKPLLRHLDELDGRGFRYYFQMTLNDYPALFEPGLAPLDARVEQLIALSERIGPERVVWRYDPIIVSTATPVAYHIETLAALAERLQGHSVRLVISFLDMYGKVEKRLAKLRQLHPGLALTDIAAPEQRGLLAELMQAVQAIAARTGFTVQSCAEAADLSLWGTVHGACIDAELLARSGPGGALTHRKDRNQRSECLCTEAVDIGMYNTCLFNCTYCYAVQSDKAVRSALQRHVPGSASLLYDYGPGEPERP